MRMFCIEAGAHRGGGVIAHAWRCGVKCIFGSKFLIHYSAGDRGMMVDSAVVLR